VWRLLTPIVLAGALGSLPAYAYHCPQMMQQLDTLIAQHPNLTHEQLLAVKKLEAEGLRLHLAGNHGASMTIIAKAIRLVNSSGPASTP
jgi:hypothetical protein